MLICENKRSTCQGLLLDKVDESSQMFNIKEIRTKATNLYKTVTSNYFTRILFKTILEFHRYSMRKIK